MSEYYVLYRDHMDRRGRFVAGPFATAESAHDYCRRQEEAGKPSDFMRDVQHSILDSPFSSPDFKAKVRESIRNPPEHTVMSCAQIWEAVRRGLLNSSQMPPGCRD